MPVPRMTALQSGTAVNIILKADQATGALTTGRIADILTRGDHPRGIKVRLTDGRIGRVRSLASSSPGPVAAGGTAGAEPVAAQMQAAAVARGEQRDFRNESQPDAATGSLLDYVKPPRRKGKKGAVGVRGEEQQQQQQEEESRTMTSWQQLLEKEFPRLDTALIAAILSDNEADLATVRAMLLALS